MAKFFKSVRLFLDSKKIKEALILPTDEFSYESLENYCDDLDELSYEAWWEVHGESSFETAATSIAFEQSRDSVLEIMYPDIVEVPIVRQCTGCHGLPCEECIVTTSQGDPSRKITVDQHAIHINNASQYKTVEELEWDYLDGCEYPETLDLDSFVKTSNDHFSETRSAYWTDSISKETGRNEPKTFEKDHRNENHNSSSFADLDDTDMINGIADDVDQVCLIMDTFLTNLKFITSVYGILHTSDNLVEIVLLSYIPGAYIYHMFRWGLVNIENHPYKGSDWKRTGFCPPIGLE